MNLSATLIGKRFSLNGQEMNAVLKVLNILDGEPGNYALTELGEQFGRYNYFDNGYGGYAARAWDTTSYDESIVDWINERISPEIVKEALERLKEHRAAVKAAQIAAQKAFEEEKIRKAAEMQAAIENAARRNKNIKTAIVVGLVVVAAVAIGAGVYSSIKKHKARKREQAEKERAMEMAMNAYYYNSNADKGDAQPDNLTQ